MEFKCTIAKLTYIRYLHILLLNLVIRYSQLMKKNNMFKINLACHTIKNIEERICTFAPSQIDNDLENFMAMRKSTSG